MGKSTIMNVDTSTKHIVFVLRDSNDFLNFFKESMETLLGPGAYNFSCIPELYPSIFWNIEFLSESIEMLRNQIIFATWCEALSSISPLSGPFGQNFGFNILRDFLNYFLKLTELILRIEGKDFSSMLVIS